jgi:hypothetical protein
MNKRLRDESGQQAVSGARDALARAVGDSVGSPAARQARVDELCWWLRRVWSLAPDPAPLPAELGEVAHDMARLLSSRLRSEPGEQDSFAGLDLDLSGTALEVDFSEVRFTAGPSISKDASSGRLFHLQMPSSMARVSSLIVRHLEARGSGEARSSLGQRSGDRRYHSRKRSSKMAFLALMTPAFRRVTWILPAPGLWIQCSHLCAPTFPALR